MLDKNELNKKGIAEKQKEENPLLSTLKRHYPHILQDGKISLKSLKESLAKALNLQDANELENMQNLGGYELNFTGKGLANALYNSECEKELKLDEIFELNAVNCHDNFNIKNEGEAEISSTQRVQDFGDKNGALQGEARELPQTVMTEAKPKQSPFLAQKTSPYTFKVNNMIIKGDNLDALKLLKSAYSGKIKMIYIDPPYNTDSDNFIYRDSFRDDYKAILREVGLIETLENGEEVESENLKFFKNITGSKTHSGWLCFMLPRLKLARDLLKDDGVIFISIDDNEQANLKLLCDEIFGEENFVSCFVWRRKTGASDAKGIANITEYILCYIKNNNFINSGFNENTKSHDEKRYKLSDEYISRRGKYYIDNLDRGGIHYSDSLNYAIECPDGTITYPNGRKKFINDGWVWTWGKEKLKWGIKNGFIEFRHSKSKESGWAVCYKNYLFVDNEDKEIKRSAPHKNLILDILNTHATLELNKLMGSKIFDKPKPVNLIKHLLKIATNTNVVDCHEFDKSNSQSGGAEIESSLHLKAEAKSTLDCHSEGVQSTTEESINTKNNSTSHNGYFANAQYDKNSKSQSLAQEPDIILDFFAGSGTTAHAVMELNAEDGGNREFILVQLEEKIDPTKANSSNKAIIEAAYQFCKNELSVENPVISDITIERVKRAAKKIYEKMKINDEKDSKAKISRTQSENLNKDNKAEISSTQNGSIDKDSKAEVSLGDFVGCEAGSKGVCLSQMTEADSQNSRKSVKETTPNFNFKVFSLKNKSKIITSDKNSLKIEDKSDLSPLDKALNLILQSGKSLNKDIKTIIENKLYECENAYFVVNLDKEVLAFLQDTKSEIYLNGFLLDDLEAFLNVGLKENITVIF